MTNGAILIGLFGVWLVIGAAVAVIFLVIAIGRVDDNARGAYTFRPLLVPGILLLWPIVLWRWWQIETARGVDIRRDVPLRDAHATVWMMIAILIPIILVASLSIRQSPVAPSDAAVRLDIRKQ